MTKVESTSTVICPPCWISGWPKFLLFFLIVCYCLFQEFIAPLLAKGFLGAGGAMRKILANVFVSSRIISIIWLLLAMTDECSLCETYGEELCMYLSGCRWCGTSQKCIVRNDNCPSCSSVRKTEVLVSLFIYFSLFISFFFLFRLLAKAIRLIVLGVQQQDLALMRQIIFLIAQSVLNFQ